ncbi:MAG TPA: hypothetical protein VJT50_14260 [Pyrinomonadaceae bacterium]|nr:hypothetical protein [Pyrinomonadaceae bacterium]
MKRSLTLHRFLAPACALLMFALSLEAYGQLFDTTFNNADWSATIIPFPISAQVGAQNCGTAQFLLGTNQTRQTCMQFPSSGAYPPAIWIAHVYLPFTYTPSNEGPIGSVSFSYDLNPYTETPTYRLLLVQGGKLFYSVNSVSNPAAPNDHPGGPTGSPLWKSIVHGNYTAQEFQQVSNVGSRNNPDFSCNGGPIQFGYATGISTQYYSVSRIDNWKVDIHKAGCLCFIRTKETIACSVGGSGSYAYSVTLQNLTAVTIPQISVVPTLPTGVTVTPQTFSVALGVNQLVTLNMTITAPPGSTVLLRLFPTGVDSRCCSPEIRITMPLTGQC